jgi:hypothetical protein
MTRSLAALILTKGADILTTVRGMRRWGIAGERNPLARVAMLRWGVGGGIAAIMVLWLAVVLMTYLPVLTAAAWRQWAVAGMGCFIAWCQREVARHHATGRPTRFTALMHRFYAAWRA